jgi:RNA polymerase sigma factor (sigma-70 family)
MAEPCRLSPFDPALIALALVFARYFGAREQDVEDLAQEALLKLITYSGTIENPSTWLFVVVRRLQKQWTRHLEAPLPRTPPSVDPWPAVELGLDARRVFARLSLRARRSLSLSLAGYSERETAECLGCSVKATEKTLHKARQRARRLLADG